MKALLTKWLKAASLASVMAIAAPVTQALAMDKAEIIAAVESRYSDVDTISANFVQIARSELFGDEKESGRLLIKRPSKMRWSFGDQKLFITDGTKMWIYTAEERQVIEYDDISASRSTADQFLTSLDKLDEYFKVSVISSTETEHVLELLPNETEQFKKIKLTLDGKLLIQQVIITDTFDNVTELSFTDMVLGKPIADSEFVFTAPEGATVIKGTTN